MKPDPFPLGFVAHINAKMWPYPDGWFTDDPAARAKAREVEQRGCDEACAKADGRPYI